MKSGSPESAAISSAGVGPGGGGGGGGAAGVRGFFMRPDFAR
jgi:hypothetical protein